MLGAGWDPYARGSTARAAWRIRDMATREVVVTQESRISQQAGGATRSEIVSAQSQSIVALSREIAGALRNIE